MPLSPGAKTSRRPGGSQQVRLDDKPRLFQWVGRFKDYLVVPSQREIGDDSCPAQSSVIQSPTVGESGMFLMARHAGTLAASATSRQ